METPEATPPRPPLPTPTSPSPLTLRRWRPAAQRNLRNQWSRLIASKARWLAAAADGRSYAAALVNAHLSRRYMPGMDLGAVKDMAGIREKACDKLARREEQYCNKLLSAYKEMVLAALDLVKASRSMRCFLKVCANGSFVQFSDHQDDLHDLGDGGGAAVFKWFSIIEFENLARELVEMFVLELHSKRLLILELLSINFKEGVEQHTLLEWADELYHGESFDLQNISLQSGESCPLPKNWHAEVSETKQSGRTLSHEVLQVYLTTWLANVNIKLSRIDEIFEVVGEEMQIKLS